MGRLLQANEQRPLAQKSLLSLIQLLVRQTADYATIILALSGKHLESLSNFRSHFSQLMPRQQIRVWWTPDVIGNATSSPWDSQINDEIRESFILSLRPDILLLPELLPRAGLDSPPLPANPSKGFATFSFLRRLSGISTSSIQ